MIEDLLWFGIRWNLGPGSGPSSSQNIEKNNEKIEKIVCEKEEKKEKIEKKIFEKYFCGVNLAPFSDLFFQSERLQLYIAAIKKLFELGLGEFVLRVC